MVVWLRGGTSKGENAVLQGTFQFSAIPSKHLVYRQSEPYVQMPTAQQKLALGIKLHVCEYTIVGTTKYHM